MLCCFSGNRTPLAKAVLRPSPGGCALPVVNDSPFCSLKSHRRNGEAAATARRRVGMLLPEDVLAWAPSLQRLFTYNLLIACERPPPAAAAADGRLANSAPRRKKLRSTTMLKMVGKLAIGEARSASGTFAARSAVAAASAAAVPPAHTPPPLDA